MNKKVTLFSISFFLLASFQASAQSVSRPLLNAKIDETRLHRLMGNTRPEANASNDRGRVADNFGLDHMLLQLQRGPAEQQALDGFIDTLHNPQSPSFHRWLTPAEFASRFGSAGSDVATVTAWLQSHGFTVNSVYPNGLVIDFSGNAGQIRQAFHTEIHALDVNGVPHIANMSDPMIPEALAPVVAGILSLHDFKPEKMATKRAAHPEFTTSAGGYIYEAVTPGDLAVIYNLNPLFANGQTGAGQTIALIEDADLFTAKDWSTFRSTFGLDQYTAGSLTTVHPRARSARASPATAPLPGLPRATMARPRSMWNGPAPPLPTRPLNWSPAPAAASPGAA